MLPVMGNEFPQLARAVQRNCDISDARYAGDYGLCTFLLKMREYYRWECALPFACTLPKEALGEWLDARERVWDGLEPEAFSPLPIADGALDPFDADAANRVLLPRGCVYGAGYGRFQKPMFFLARLLRVEERAGLTVLVSSREYARELAAPPALLQGRMVFVRMESVRRYLWALLPSFGFLIANTWSVLIVMAMFTAIFTWILYVRGKDQNHRAPAPVRSARSTWFVTPEYHALHHVYPDCYLGSYTTTIDRLVGTACQLRGRRAALSGSSGAFGSALKELLEAQGAEVRVVRSGVDFRPGDYSGADPSLAWADILVLAHGAKGEQADWANCESFLELIARFKRLADRDRPVPPEVWAVGSEIECHPTFGSAELRSYARSKRAFARQAARLMDDPAILYRHIVPSAFRSRMGPGLMSGKTAAAWALFLIRRGFRYVPVTYTGIALLNFVPFRLRGLLSPPIASRGSAMTT